MKSNVRLFVFIFVAFFCLCPPGLCAQLPELPFPDPSVTISMDLQDATLKDILKIFSIQSGLSFIASEAVKDRTLTLYLDKLPVKVAMDKIFEANNLSYELDRDSNIFIVKDWGKPMVETVTKVFYLKYASVGSSPFAGEVSSKLSVQRPPGGILDTVKKLLSSNGSVVEDYRTNSLIITDVPSRIPIIAETIGFLDIPVPQVMLEVELLDVNKDVVDKLGFEFSNSPLTLVLPGSFARRGFSAFIGDVATKGTAGAVEIGGHYAESLNFLRTHTDTKYLARPKIMTLNNETAEIFVTKDEIVERKATTETTTSGSVTNYEYKRSTDLKLTPEGVGVYMRVTPQVNLETGEITMVILPKASTTKVSPLAGATELLQDAEVRSTKSVVKVRDGETIILGGLIHEDRQVTVKKIPIFGDLPVIGALFRHKDLTKSLERELLVFITPHIMKDKYRTAGYAKNMVLPDREQSKTSSSFERQVAISSSLNRFDVR